MGCANHPTVFESFACTSCSARLCHQCVRAIAHRYACNLCGHEARGAAPKRDGGLVDDIFRRVGSVEGLTTAAAFAVVYALSYWFWLVFFVFYGVLVAYYFTIVHHVGAKGDGLPSPSDANVDWNDLFVYAVRGFFCSVIGAAPLIIYVTVEKRVPSLETTGLLLLAGQLYMPAAVLAVAFSNSFLGAIWPIAWIRIVARAPAAYVRFLGLWFITVAVGIGVSMVTSPFTGFLGMFLAGVISNLYWFSHAVVVGSYIRDNAEAYGWD